MTLELMTLELLESKTGRTVIESHRGEKVTVTCEQPRDVLG